MKTQTYGKSKEFFCPRNCHGTSYVSLLCKAHEDKEENWTTKFLKEAYADYRTHRENGTEEDLPQGALCYDGIVKWEQQSDDMWKINYIEGTQARAWMEAKDLNYLTRLARVGTLMQEEPIWREVLGKWEPETKRTTAIASVEVAIKERAEAEAKNQIVGDLKPM